MFSVESKRRYFSILQWVEDIQIYKRPQKGQISTTGIQELSKMMPSMAVVVVQQI